VRVGIPGHQSHILVGVPKVCWTGYVTVVAPFPDLPSVLERLFGVWVYNVGAPGVIVLRPIPVTSQLPGLLDRAGRTID